MLQRLNWLFGFSFHYLHEQHDFFSFPVPTDFSATCAFVSLQDAAGSVAFTSAVCDACLLQQLFPSPIFFFSHV
jgi:hypothetical protein